MFSFFHPRPVTDSRPVAEHSVRQTRPALPALAAAPGIATPAPGTTHPPIRFTVDYGLREYIAVVHEHLSTVLAERGLAHERQGLCIRLMLALLIPPIFFLKRWRIGSCRFEIDGQRLTRRSRSGVLTLPWNEVAALHRYSGAYLVATRRGAMPLPYRCFSAGERRRFDAWTAGIRPA
ncbi:YcxB family protein [Roseateles sp.]|uniref:YcxB family protein n=1 Tax=Roseateles sp. TaxID=1971397 RepID=UPI0025D8CC45|nr:YcxB family protein [Roseateles sp.]MBV8034488.1 YcxB family protein [Roseateles sp.]